MWEYMRVKMHDGSSLARCEPQSFRVTTGQGMRASRVCEAMRLGMWVIMCYSCIRSCNCCVLLLAGSRFLDGANMYGIGNKRLVYEAGLVLRLRGVYEARTSYSVL